MTTKLSIGLINEQGMVVKRFLVLVALVFLMATNAGASSRGLSVQLRASEAKNAPVAGEVKLYTKSYALVIGIDAYSNGWPRLSNAVKDAQLVAEALRKKGFDVTDKYNLTSAQLKKAFEEFFILKGNEEEARLFVWFAGHGHTIDGEGYLVPVDASRPDGTGKFKLSALNMRRFGEFVRQANSKHVFNVFDSCFAGTVFNNQRTLPSAAITHATTQPVRQFLTSGDADQTVSDDGTFRKLFIRVLNGETKADANSDGYVTGSEMGMFLTDRMTNISRIKQTPRYGKLNHEDYDRGDFVFKLASISPSRVTGRVSPRQNYDKETIFWQSINDSDDAGDYQDYLAQYPNGSFARIAKRRMKKLTPPKAPPGILPRGTPQEQYRFAFKLLGQAYYDQAEVAWKEFLGKHGDDKLASNAHYWLGKTYYVRKRYKPAARAFYQGLKTNPKGPKASVTLLELGMSLANLDKKNEACTTFEKLKTDFPDASARVLGTLRAEWIRSGCRYSGKFIRNFEERISQALKSKPTSISSQPESISEIDLLRQRIDRPKNVAVVIRPKTSVSKTQPAEVAVVIPPLNNTLKIYSAILKGDYTDSEICAGVDYGDSAYIREARVRSLPCAEEIKIAAVKAPKPVVPSPVKPAVGIYKQRYKPGTTFEDCHNCPEMVVIPAGSFQMGDLSGGGKDDELPVHRVTIQKSFAVGKYEVTQAEYRSIMGIGSNFSTFKGKSNPVEQIQFHDTQKFVKMLRAKTGKNYRLLSEAEWEYAARAGTGSKFHCGNDEDCLDKVSWHRGNSGSQTHPVGSKEANAFGLYDMHGNVWEWVEDCWNDNYDGAPVDGSVWGDCSQHVLRGGSWNNFPRFLRSATRFWTGNFTQDHYIIGFRIARDLDESDLKASNTNQPKQVVVVNTPPTKSSALSISAKEAYSKGRKAWVNQKYSEAANWHRMAAEQGNSLSQLRLANMYQTGKGVDKDITKSYKWYSKAVKQVRKIAEQGNAIYQNILGIMYQNGLGLEKDRAKAKIWLQKSAELENPLGQLNYGKIYYWEGDYSEARKWIQKSADQGNLKAKQWLSKASNTTQ
jgi:tol-pal system protein YbgF